MAGSTTNVLRPRGIHVERIGTDRAKVVVELSPTPIELVDFYAPPRAEGD